MLRHLTGFFRRLCLKVHFLPDTTLGEKLMKLIIRKSSISMIALTLRSFFVVETAGDSRITSNSQTLCHGMRINFAVTWSPIIFIKENQNKKRAEPFL